MYGVTSPCFETLNLEKVIIEGGNFGLEHDEERAQGSCSALMRNGRMARTLIDRKMF